jgi:methylated-DNA-protein-cysteine methyltransferase-like protein
MKPSRFFEDVWDVVRLIPCGRVTTYGAIAKYLGVAKSSRMVGWAMNASHQQSQIPAHRVVNRNGLLTGKLHFNEKDSMERLLHAEGISVENDRVLQFDQHFWDPNVEIPFP